MNVLQLLDEILPRLGAIRDDRDKLAKLLAFMEEAFFSNEEEIESDDSDYKEKLPKKYRDIVRQIADNLSANQVCFFNPDTLELEDFSKKLLNELVFDENDEENEFGLTFMTWDDCVRIDPLESHELFVIMEDFVNQLKSGGEADELAQAINGHKPFAHFNHLIHNSQCKNDWFAFRQKELERYVIKHYFHEYLEDN
ncbi:MAG: hypothetical protein LBT83_00980 [Tannerella sp.]|jgi:hypothetical protein|nr:hypothetical protein [Tannerella sp.]